MRESVGTDSLIYNEWFKTKKWRSSERHFFVHPLS